MKRSAALSSLVAISIGATAVLTACSSGTGTVMPTNSASVSTDSITIVSMAGITTNNVIQRSIDRGDFTKDGLDAKLITVANPPAALAALQGGNADFAYSPISTALTALSQGIGIKIVAAADGFPDDGKNAAKYDDTAIVVNPADHIDSPKALEGKTVAVPSRNGMMEIVIAGAVKSAGGDPSKIQWLALDQQSQIAALKQGRIQAAGLATPFTNQAEAQGLKAITRPKAEFFQHGAAGVWITTDTIAKERPGAVKKFQAAVAAANTWANANLDTLAKEVIAQQKLDISPADMIVGYSPPRVRAADVERAYQQIQKLGYLKSPVNLKGIVLE